MSNSDELREEKRLDLLLQRYGQLRDINEHKNKIIYQIFYLSIVFSGVVLAGFEALDTPRIRIWMAAPISLVYSSMLLWTRTYIHSRKEIHEQINHIYHEIEAMENEIFKHRSEARLVRKAGKSDKPTRDTWERHVVKDNILQLYYAILALLPIFFILIFNFC